MTAVLREEVDRAGKTHTLVESLAWASAQTDRYYQNKDGSRVAAGDGGSAARSFSEQQLIGPPIAPRPALIEKLTRGLEDATRERDRLREKLAAAEKVGKRTNLDQLLAAAEHTVTLRQQLLEDAQGKRERYATAETTLSKDGKKISLRFGIPHRSLIAYPIDTVGVQLVGFSTRTREHHQGVAVAYVGGISSSADLASNGEAVITLHDEHKDGHPGLIGGGEHLLEVEFRRVPVNEQLVVRGSVLHRIRIPENDGDFNVIRAGGTGQNIVDWPVGAVGSSLKGALPVTGEVKVEAWLRDRGGAAPKDDPADVTASTDATTGKFEFCIPPRPDRTLHLRFTYYSKDAQLWETNEVEVATNAILQASRRLPAAGAAPLAGVHRLDTVFYRSGGAPLEQIVGTEARDATVRNEDGRAIVQFEGFNAILMNAFVLRAPYLNQNLHTVKISHVKVPVARLLKARPAFIPEGTLRQNMQNMDVPLQGPVPDEKELPTPIVVSGAVVCFPTSTVMALGGLGLIPDVTVPQSKEVQEIAQGIFDFHAEESRGRPTIHPQPPWLFPFPDPALANQIVSDASLALLDSMVTGDYLGVIQDRATVEDVVGFYAHWPYRKVDSEGDADKQWLISLPASENNFFWVRTSTGSQYRDSFEQEALRPWQAVEIVGGYLRKRFGASNISVTARNGNAFVESQPVVNALGRGDLAVVSIDQRDSHKRQGGHLLTLLGALIDNTGDLIRLIVHDPYGDQSVHPGIEGYYDPQGDDRSLWDKDPSGTSGAYAPYGRGINSYAGRIYGKYWVKFERPGAPQPDDIRSRLLPSEFSAEKPGTPEEKSAPIDATSSQK